MFRELDESMSAQLGTLADFVVRADDAALASVAKSEIPPLVATVRALLEEHKPDANGQCRVCKVRRVRFLFFWWRRPNVPCRAYLTAFQHLVGIASEQVSEGGRHSTERHRLERTAA
jgi:hypothetical protein